MSEAIGSRRATPGHWEGGRGPGSCDGWGGPAWQEAGAWDWLGTWSPMHEGQEPRVPQLGATPNGLTLCICQ